MFTNWWKIPSESESVIKMDNDFDILNINGNNESICRIAIFVRTEEVNSTSYRDIFLETIGAQSKFICKDHNIPLIAVPRGTKLQCCYGKIQNTSTTTQDCPRKNIFISCPLSHCKSSICSYHYKNVQLKDPIEVPTHTTIIANDSAVNNLYNEENEDDNENFNKENYVIESHFGNEYDTDTCSIIKI